MRSAVDNLAGAMWQLLDDMGKEGLSVCLFAKAQARLAYEPFREADDDLSYLMPLAEARRIVSEHDK